jgi:putative membrane protein
MTPMRTIGIKVLVNGVALWVAALVLSDGIHLGQRADSLSARLLTILFVAVIFGLVNAFVKPIAKLFSLPFIILTLGLFTLVVNALMLQITSWLAGALNLDFHVDSFFWDAILGALVITFVSLLLNILIPDGDDR